MSAPVEISVYASTPRAWKQWVVWALFWGTLVGSLGVSRAWFGGAVILDLIIGALAFLAFVGLLQMVKKVVLKVSVADMQAWAADGAPADIVTWIRRRQL